MPPTSHSPSERNRATAAKTIYAEEMSSAVHYHEDRQEAREVALQVQEQSLPTRPTPARPGRTCGAPEGSAAARPRPQPQPQQRRSTLRGSPARPIMRRSV